ncbi:MAG: hypothetical protein IIB02_08180 [Thaumarchaeota archaeon]|nr:hypothetical protein [Nitrososphaerota archaeon]
MSKRVTIVLSDENLKKLRAKQAAAIKKPNKVRFIRSTLTTKGDQTKFLSKLYFLL